MPSQRRKKQVAVRIPLRQKVALEREAAQRGVSRSEYIRGILEIVLKAAVGNIEQSLTI
jgi:predicted DNA binding CopG/RHH family protein